MLVIVPFLFWRARQAIFRSAVPDIACRLLSTPLASETERPTVDSSAVGADNEGF